MSLQLPCGLVAGVLLVTGGCASPSLDGARHQFYQGRIDAAAQSLDAIEPAEKEEILYRMERGMILQQAGRYEDSTQDFLTAAARIEAFEAYSISEGATSWIINDTVYTFRGKPYERILLHAFTALNFLALGDWDGAAVESRQILDELQPDVRGDYPDGPYARYLAGFCFEMIGDPSNARLQYRTAAELVEWARIDPDTGRITGPERNPEADPDWHAATGELVCFVHMGHATGQEHPDGSPGPFYAEIVADGVRLGRSYTLVDTARLAALTDAEEAIRHSAKTAARFALKEGLAQAAAEGAESRAAGDLARLVLFGLLEQPDLRHWDTLPRWLQVARVPCPPDAENLEVVIRYQGGREAARYPLPTSLPGNRFTRVALCRYLGVSP